MQPMRSMDAINGLFVFGINPATTGSTKYGPNLLPYRRFETTCEKAVGEIFLFSLNSYKLVLNFAKLDTVWISVANPESPRYKWSPIGNIFSKSNDIVCIFTP